MSQRTSYWFRSGWFLTRWKWDSTLSIQLVKGYHEKIGKYYSSEFSSELSEPGLVVVDDLVAAGVSESRCVWNESQVDVKSSPPVLHRKQFKLFLWSPETV